jgi:hypothetical protein
MNSASDSLLAIDSSEIYIQMLLFAIRVHTKDENGQLEVLERCKRIKGVNGKHFLRMACYASREDSERVEVPMLAFRSALKLILGEVNPDYASAALVMRKLITLSDIMDKDGREARRVYEECRGVLVGLPPGAYPKDEVRWLVSTAWNRAYRQVRSNKPEDARYWMNIALELLRFAPFMSGYEETMRKGLEELEKANIIGVEQSSPMEE